VNELCEHETNIHALTEVLNRKSLKSSGCVPAP